VKNIFYNILCTTEIGDLSFSQIWNLLDLILVMGDNGSSDAAFIFWLVEELLESQTIRGCQRVFDYLESRRERLTRKHFARKQQAILRTCNELLRRLSRAEDTVFCGRVFMFLFQSFPLGEKSSVNLRGEYHTSNVTIYDETLGPDSEQMDVDEATKEESKVEETSQATTQISVTAPNGKESKAKDESKVINEEPVLDTNALYPVFWSLQSYFSNPTKLFKPEELTAFKSGLEATLDKFRAVQKQQDTRGTRSPDDSRKRKRSLDSGDMASSFNPKYLTSRDLFELEISDLAFRRHVLVQSLIVTDFLLSLTAKSKIKYENLKNRTVLYDFTLDDTEVKLILSA
jgi:THO complex subunit 1